MTPIQKPLVRPAYRAPSFIYWGGHVFLVVALGILLLGSIGCGRGYYRRQADQDAYCLVASASTDPRWPLDGFSIEPDPRSRMFDPFCADCPPMPPDDPTAHRLMHCVDCKEGWPCWHCNGDTPIVENPAWMAYLPADEQGRVLLDRDGAVSVALIHSRDYQQQLEAVYLAALDVSLQRFQFDTQFYGGNSTYYTASGRLAGGQTVLGTTTDLQMRRAFATGADLVVGAANSLVWQFAGPDTYSATTLLDFSLVQPLLRGSGRAVALESLTSSERALLGDIRTMERFRRSFYVQTVSNHLALLEEQVRIRNQEANVSQLRQSLDRLEAAYEGGATRRGDVDRTRQSLYNSQSGLLAINASYETRLDTYKMNLGLPPSLDVVIEDPLLTRFDLISPRLTATRNALLDMLNQLRPLQNEGQLVPEDHFGLLTTLRQDAMTHIEAVDRDVLELQEALPSRRESLRQLAQREEIRSGAIEPTICDVAALDERAIGVQKEHASVVENLSRVMQQLETFPPAANAPGSPEEDARASIFIDLIEEMAQHLLELSLVQAQARLDTITFVPVDLKPEEAFEIARENRRDWMDARAALVDSWRQIELRADDLRSALDVTFSGDISTTDNNPAQFRSSTGRLRVGLEFDAPLTRMSERNAYRRALIDYQRARREYYAFEDRVSQSLRSRLRTIRLNQLDFEVQRAAVLVAIARVDETGRRLNEPPKQGGTMQLGDSFVERLVSDFSALLSAQNAFLSVWVEQELQRMNLDLDLGTMQLDPNGFWIDPGPIEGGQLISLIEEPFETFEPTPAFPVEPPPVPVEDPIRVENSLPVVPEPNIAPPGVFFPE